MLLRNRRSYAMLSVTIVLSFSLLLGYLAFTDSQLYNRYKHLFSLDSNMVIGYNFDDNGSRHALLEKQALAADPNALVYHYCMVSTLLPQYAAVHAQITFLPQGKYPLYVSQMWSDSRYGDIYNYCEKYVPLFGREDFCLQADEAIINLSFYEAVRNGRELPFSISMPIEWKDGSVSTRTVTVVGVCDDRLDAPLEYNEQGIPHGYVHIYLSQAAAAEKGLDALPTNRWCTFLYSANPNVMTDLVRRQGDMIVHCVSEAQTQAVETMRIQTGTKAMVAAAMLLLLGINLYSSFTNALNDRKFEIGVKRAIGAPGWAIVLQFLVESVLVMAVNILVSVAVVTDGLIFYKLCQQLVHEQPWVVRISGYSVLMFAMCAVSLTLVFSLLFAYRSTQVEVVSQLKAE